MIRSSYGGIFRSRNLGGTWFRADVGLFLNAPLIVAVALGTHRISSLAPISDCSARATVGSPGLLKRRPRRGKENRDAGRSLGTAGGAHDCTGPVVLTVSVHLSLNCPSTLVQETVLAFTTGWYRDVLTDLPDMRDGFVYPMAGPGLGTRLQPERLTAADCQRRVTKA